MTHRSLITPGAFLISLLLATPALAKWRVQFIPDEASGVAVSINGERALTWSSSEGERFKDLPAKFATLETIHVRAESTPTGKKGRVKVYWNDDEECDMKFEDGDSCDVGR
jgi:hypothetical protein